MTSQTRDTLPKGWVREFDESSQHPFWVDTNAKPPRSIWVHPFEDEQFLNEHPDIRERVRAEAGNASPPDDLPPPYSPRRHSYSGSTPVAGASSSRRNELRPSASQPATPKVEGRGSKKQRGFFSKLKDKAIGTKEEREEEKRQHAAYMQQLAEQRREQLRQQRASAPYGYPGASRYQQSSIYGPPTGSPYRSSYGYGSGYGGMGMGGMSGMGGMGGMSSMGGMGGMGGRRGGGFGGIGLPLIGGMAGGLLLGEALGGFDGGGFGGGGFDGGGFDGGGFDGGGFDGGFN